MKLTKREANLLKLTGLVLVLALSYYFVIAPQLDKLTSAKEQLEIKTREVEEVKGEIASIPQLEIEIKNLQESIKQSSQKFLPEIQQKKLIILLDEQLRESNAIADSIGFSQISDVDTQAGDSQSAGEDNINNVSTGNENSEGVSELTELLKFKIYTMSVQAPLSGKYEEIMNFISRLENLNRTVAINSLQLTKDIEGKVNGSIGLDFYSMNKIVDDPNDEAYLGWPYNTPKGVDNPFPFESSDTPEINEPSQSEESSAVETPIGEESSDETAELPVEEEVNE